MRNKNDKIRELKKNGDEEEKRTQSVAFRHHAKPSKA